VDISHFLNQTGVWKRHTGADLYGDPTFAPGVNVKMRWEDRPKLVVNGNAESVPSNARVWVREAVSVSDLFTYAGQDHQVIAITTVPDLAGRVTFTEAALS
jgi:hypothetical protein